MKTEKTPSHDGHGRKISAPREASGSLSKADMNKGHKKLGSASPLESPKGPRKK